MAKCSFFKEVERLGSFHPCTPITPGPIMLAKAGFYRLKGDTDVPSTCITCPWCGVRERLASIYRGRETLSIHDASCRFLSGESENVPIPVPGLDQEREIKLKLERLAGGVLNEGSHFIVTEQGNPGQLSHVVITGCGSVVGNNRNELGTHLNSREFDVSQSGYLQAEVPLGTRFNVTFRGSHPQQREGRHSPNVDICLSTGEIMPCQTVGGF